MLQSSRCGTTSKTCNCVCYSVGAAGN